MPQPAALWPLIWHSVQTKNLHICSSVEQSSIARHCCPPSHSIFCCRLKSHLFSLSYPAAFWLFSHLYSDRAVTRHYGHCNRYYIYNIYIVNPFTAISAGYIRRWKKIIIPTAGYIWQLYIDGNVTMVYQITMNVVCGYIMYADDWLQCWWSWVFPIQPSMHGFSWHVYRIRYNIQDMVIYS